MGFTEKTNYLLETKSLLKDRINSLGGSITSGTTFRDYLVWLDSLYEALDEKTITGLPDSLEGKCEQEGTPTPTSPQPINITTGRQVVSVCGKNLFNVSTITESFLNVNNGNVGTNSAWRTSDFIPVKANTTYNFSWTSDNNYFQVNVVYYNGSNAYISGESFGQSNIYSKSFTTPNNTQYIRVAYSVRVGGVNVNRSNIQVEKNNQATTYEEYKGNDYEINLGKNLYYMNYTDFSHTWNSLTIISTTTGYSLSGTATGGGDYTLVNRYMTLPAGTYTMVLENASSMVVGLSKNNYASILRIPIGSTSGTFTLSEETKVCLTLRVVNGTTYDETNNIMIEKGSQASSFSPYKTPIYLGEIGNYKDYIFRNTTENPLYDSNLEEGQWYIHKEIGRVVLNGSESWRRTGTKTSGNYYFFQDDILSNVKFDGSNRFIGMSNMGITTNAYQEIQGFDTIYHNNQYVRSRFYSDTTKTMSTSDFATWLSTHPLEVYYVLNTPTNTLIEDEELINQLNEIEIFTVISEDFYN